MEGAHSSTWPDRGGGSTEDLSSLLSSTWSTLLQVLAVDEPAIDSQPIETTLLFLCACLLFTHIVFVIRHFRSPGDPKKQAVNTCIN